MQPDAPPDFASGAATPTSRALGAVPAFACGQESTPILRLLESGHPPLGCARNIHFPWAEGGGESSPLGSLPSGL